MSETKPKTKIKGNLTPLAVFLANGKKDAVFFTDKPNNYIHAQCLNYGRVTSLEQGKVIIGNSVTDITKVTILE